MDNMYCPPGGPECRTDPYGSVWPEMSAPAGPQGSQQARPQHLRYNRAARWTAIGVLTASLIGGGVIAVAAVTASPPAGAAAAPAGQAALLNTMLGSAGSAGGTVQAST